MADIKQIAAIAGSVGTAVTLAKTVSGHFEEQSLLARRKREVARTVELMEFLSRLRENRGLRSNDQLERSVQDEVTHGIDLIERFTAKLTSKRSDPNADLSTWERIFLLYRPKGIRAWVAHVLTYMFYLSLPAFLFGIGVPDDGDFSVQEWIKQAHDSSTYFAAGGFLFWILLCRAWALIERRRSLDPQRPPGKWAMAFGFVASTKKRALMAQLCSVINLVGIAYALSFIAEVSGSRGMEELDRSIPLFLIGFLALFAWSRAWALVESKVPEEFQVPFRSLVWPKPLHLSRPLVVFYLSLIWAAIIAFNLFGLVQPGEGVLAYFVDVFGSGLNAATLIYFVVLPVYSSFRMLRLSQSGTQQMQVSAFATPLDSRK